MVAFFYLRSLGIGRSILVSCLYSAKPSFFDCLPSAIGMLTARKRIVLRSAPTARYHISGRANTTAPPTPHHISISAR